MERKNKKKEVAAVDQPQLLHSFSGFMETMRGSSKMNERHDLKTIKHTASARLS